MKLNKKILAILIAGSLATVAHANTDASTNVSTETFVAVLKKLEAINNEMGKGMLAGLEAANTEIEKKADKADYETFKDSTIRYLAGVDDFMTAADESFDILDADLTALEEKVANIQQGQAPDVTHKADKSYVDQIDKNMKNGLAAQAALNGLFQPYNVGKINVSAAVGGYQSTTAMAVGTGYRFNQNFATKAGVAVSGGKVSYNAGVNFEW